MAHWLKDAANATRNGTLLSVYCLFNNKLKESVNHKKCKLHCED